MDVNNFLILNAKYFPEEVMPTLRETLSTLRESKLDELAALQYKDPMMMLIVSFLGGGLGIDRFMIGDTGMGVGKLLTGGGCGVWAIVDLFLIMEATRKKNYEKLMKYINY